MRLVNGSLMLALLHGSVDATSVQNAPEHVQPGTVLVLGELHGTTEIPNFVAELVASVSRHHPVVLGLEQQEDTANLPCGRAGHYPSSWIDIQDGRSSVAMRHLICVLTTRQARRRVKIVWLDRRTEANPVFDPVAAATFLGEYTDKQAIGIVLAGNAHARNTSNSFAGFLRKAGTNVVTATVSSAQADSTAWQCRSDGCGVKTGGSNLCLANSTRPEWIKSPDPRWDYCLLLPKLTASQPAAAHF
jgi:hypothetical protein